MLGHHLHQVDDVFVTKVFVIYHGPSSRRDGFGRGSEGSIGHRAAPGYEALHTSRRKKIEDEAREGAGRRATPFHGEGLRDTQPLFARISAIRRLPPHWLGGLEPMTFPWFYGGPGQNRTADTLVLSHSK
jgi:hypothetical protein